MINNRPIFACCWLKIVLILSIFFCIFDLFIQAEANPVTYSSDQEVTLTGIFQSAYQVPNRRHDITQDKTMVVAVILPDQPILFNNGVESLTVKYMALDDGYDLLTKDAKYNFRDGTHIEARGILVPGDYLGFTEVTFFLKSIKEIPSKISAAKPEL